MILNGYGKKNGRDDYMCDKYVYETRWLWRFVFDALTGYGVMFPCLMISSDGVMNLHLGWLGY